MMNIPVILASDNNYAPYMSVLMISILKNAKSNPNFDFYLLVPDNFKNEFKTKIENDCNFYGNKQINFINMKNAFCETKRMISHISEQTYYRLRAAEILPDKYDKCIYLDIDIIVNSDLSNLYNIDLEDNYVAGVKAASYHFNENFHRRHCEEVGLPDICQYINAGVIVLNLKKIRVNNITSLLCTTALNNFPSQDQDVINKVFYNHIKQLPFKYNVMTKYKSIADSTLPEYEKLCNLFGSESISEAISNPLIIHYADKIKPWQDKSCIFSNYWWKYAKCSRFYYTIFFRLIKHYIKNFQIQNIFSIKNFGIHKIFNICGIKIKFKNQKLITKLQIEQERIDRLNSLNKLQEQINALKKINESFKQKNQQTKRDFEYKLCKYMAEEKYPEYLKDWFYKCTGKELNLDNPQTFNEKIQWMKLYDSTPLKTSLADKYLVRDWIKEKIGEEYLIPLLGVWDKFDDIDFDKLPDKFVLKANHGSAWNIIVTDKNKFDKQDAKKKFDEWLHTNFAFQDGLELHYKDIKPLIIAEKYIENDNQDLYDYKIWCFDGKAKYIQFLSERKEGLKMVFYDTEWNKQDFVYSYPRNEKDIEKPKNLELLLTLAEKLAQGFSHVRVDFYILNDGSIKFGEMTFTSMSGACKWVPNDTNKVMGDLIAINKE